MDFLRKKLIISSNSVQVEKLKNDVTEKLSPYIRKGSKIVYYVPSKNQYKARIPKALLEDGKSVPQCASTELQMWNRLYSYLFGDSKMISLESAYGKWIALRKNDPDVSSKTFDRNVNTWNKYYAGHPITKIPLDKLTPTRFMTFINHTQPVGLFQEQSLVILKAS